MVGHAPQNGGVPMHLVLLCNEYPPASHGGIGSFTQTMARALAKRGHKVTVVGFYHRRKTVREHDHGVAVVRLAHARLRGSGLILNRKRLARELARINAESPIDIIEGAENSLALVPKLASAAKIIRMHGGHHFFFTTLGKKPRLWRSWLEKQSFRNADHLCGVSQYVAETTRELLDLGERPIEVLHNPVNVELFRPRPDVAEERGLIVFVGTVCEKKGVRQLVEAMPEIVAAVPHARLCLAGRDGRDPRTGQSFIEQLRAGMPAAIAAQIEFRGQLEHALVPDLLARAEVLAYPSHMEAIGIALIEGLAAGKGLVIGNTGPAREVVEHGVSGLLCDPFSPASIANAVIMLLKDQSLRRKLGEEARRRAVDLFSLDIVVQRNEMFYRRCLGRETHE
jgi:glycosyltransferase involved in cell wall biosynthesis